MFLARLDDVFRRALAVVERYEQTRPLAAVGALNTIVTAMAHLRAVEGLDAPKEARVQQDGTIRAIWSEDDDVPGSIASFQ